MRLEEKGIKEYAKDYALRMIEDNIIKLVLEPGSMVSEMELATKMGLSRGPVREALIELSKVKMVEVYPQRGSFIALIDYDLIEETCFMRETLEVAAALRSCEQGLQPEIKAALHENVNLQKFYMEPWNQDKLWELDNDFHRLLFLNANLSVVFSHINSILIHFDRVRAMSLAIQKTYRTFEEHALLLQAIEERDTQTVQTLTHEHINRYKSFKDEICKTYPQYIKQ